MDRFFDPATQFWPHVDRHGDDECWPWTSFRNNGYGRFGVSVAGGKVYAHRFAYELLVGPIPDGLTIDHLCRNTRCVNPAHLEPVTIGENSLRGTGPSAIHARATHCPKGHPYDAENTSYSPEGGRRCRACNRAHVKRFGWDRVRISCPQCGLSLLRGCLRRHQRREARGFARRPA